MLKYKVETLIKTIERQPHIVKIIRDDKWEIPPISSKLWNKDPVSSIEAFSHYLLYPYILDDFADHGARR